jgi:type I site-specific restriction endonuclease
MARSRTTSWRRSPARSTSRSTASRRSRTIRVPKYVVTVDLLTTGIDVPAIANLVFVRRVNSRILYDQMIGRATRRCDEIGKEYFRIFDAVDIYANLQEVTDMRPVVVDPRSRSPRLSATSNVRDDGGRPRLRPRPDRREAAPDGSNASTTSSAKRWKPSSVRSTSLPTA